jgi:methylamine dehydrogenase accessory protein MauD
VALWVLVVVLTIIVLGLVRQLGLIHLRLGPDGSRVLGTHEGLELGTLAPDFTATDIVHQTEITLTRLKMQTSILVFASQSCSACLKLMPHIAKFHRSQNGKIQIVLFNQDDIERSLELAQSFELDIPIIADSNGTIAKEYQVRATPFAYRLDKKGYVLRRGIVNDLEGLIELLEDAPSSEITVELPQEGV